MQADRKNRELKLIAIVLPEPLFSFVRSQQNLIASKWGSRHALRSPPHITIIPPILPDDEQLIQIQKIADRIASTLPAFHLTVTGYGAFKPRVIFLKPEPSDTLQSLHEHWRTRLKEDIPGIIDKYPDREYHPHITLAHRDVDKDQFRSIWEYYSKLCIDISVTISQFCILTNTTDGWTPQTFYPLHHNK